MTHAAVLVLRRLKQEDHEDTARMLGYVFTYILVYLYVYIQNLIKINKQNKELECSRLMKCYASMHAAMGLIPQHSINWT